MRIRRTLTFILLFVFLSLPFHKPQLLPAGAGWPEARSGSGAASPATGPGVLPPVDRLKAGLRGLAGGWRSAQAPAGGTAWTLLFYLDGDNSLSATYEAAFNYLEASAGSPAVQVAVLLDRIEDGDSRYYHVQPDDDLSQMAEYEEGLNTWSLGEVDMSDPNTLADFIAWGVAAYPARHYALILDDHGYGLKGGLDDAVSGGLMSLAEMRQALGQAQQQTGIPMDVLYLAMCSMGMLEIGYQFRGQAAYYVANQNVQWAYLKPYSAYVSAIGPDTTPRQAAQAFADAYARQAELGGMGYTISAADLSQVEALAAATHRLGGRLAAGLDALGPDLARLRPDIQHFDNEGELAITPQDNSVDLYDLALRVQQEFGADEALDLAARQVMAAVDGYIVFERHASGQAYQLDGSRGVAVYLPNGPDLTYDLAQIDFANWQPAPTWGSFVRQYAQGAAAGWQNTFSQPVVWPPGPQLLGPQLLGPRLPGPQPDGRDGLQGEG